MNKTTLLELLAAVQSGSLTPAAATERLANLPYEDLGHASIDHHRTLRTGLPEVIYAQTNPLSNLRNLCPHGRSGSDVLATRVDEATALAVLATVPAAHPPSKGPNPHA